MQGPEKSFPFPSGELTTKKRIPKTTTLNHLSEAEFKALRLDVEKLLTKVFKNDINAIPIPFPSNFKDSTIGFLKEPKHYKNILVSVLDQTDKVYKISFDPIAQFEK